MHNTGDSQYSMALEYSLKFNILARTDIWGDGAWKSLLATPPTTLMILNI